MKASCCDLKALAERMKAAREVLKLSQSAFIEEFGYGSVRSYQKNEAGLNEGGMFLAGAFVRAGINANWLLTGEGPMLLKDFAPKLEPFDVDALGLILAGILQAMGSNIDPERAATKALQYYRDAIEEGLITPEGGVGEGGKRAA